MNSNQVHLLGGDAVHLPAFLSDLNAYGRLLEELQRREAEEGRSGTYWRNTCSDKLPEPSVTRVKRMQDLDKYPMHAEIVRRIRSLFKVQVEGWWVNHYADGSSVKRMHHDGWGRQRGVNITVGASFGSPRTLCFEAVDRALKPQKLTCLQRDGDVFAFGQKVNNQYKHGIFAESSLGPRISLIMMGRAPSDWSDLALEIPVSSRKSAVQDGMCADVKVEEEKPVRRRWGRGEESFTDATPEKSHMAVFPHALLEGGETSGTGRWRKSKQLDSKPSSSPRSLDSRKACIVWLRDDLRLMDNPALFAAANSGFEVVIPVFIHNTEDPNPWPIRGAALWWKGESLNAFDASLRHHCSSRLTLRRGRCFEELMRLVEEVSARKVYFNRMPEPWYRKQDLEIEKALRDRGIETETFKSAVLQEPWEGTPAILPQSESGSWIEVSPGKLSPQNYQDHKKLGPNSTDLTLPEVLSIINADRLLSNPNPCAQLLTALGEQDLSSDPRRRDPDHFLVYQGVEAGTCSMHPLPSLRGKVLPAPSLWPFSLTVHDLGYLNTTGCGFPFDGTPQHTARWVGSPHLDDNDWASDMKKTWTPGEDAALRRLHEFIENIETHKRPDRHRGDKQNTSLLSPHLRFGEISARTCYVEAMRAPLHLRHGFIRRVLWRDLSYSELYRWPNMPVESQRPQYESESWSGTVAQLRKWQRGQTGFPLVDAAMRQLWKEGYINNYLRHITAGFLIDYLDISWKEGFKWYDYTLVDSDAAINARLWQQGGHSGISQWNFVLHPVYAAKNADPTGEYVRRWVPEIAGLPTEFIHQPWEAPLELLSLGIRLGTNYPRRMVLDITAARKQHLRHVLQVRKEHVDMVSPDGTEYLLLRDGSRVLLRTRDDIRKDTQELIVAQTPDSSLHQKKCSNQGHSSTAMGFQQLLLDGKLGRTWYGNEQNDFHIL